MSEAMTAVDGLVILGAVLACFIGLMLRIDGLERRMKALEARDAR